MEEIFLRLYPLIQKEHRCIIEPATRSREWMVENPHSFKCFPITNANSFGWDIFTSYEIDIDWNGGKRPSDLNVTKGEAQAKTNFGFGIVTFHLGYTFHTSPDWSLMFGPIPNYDHVYFDPLSALVETDKLKYPVFFSAKMKKTGKITLPAKTPLCRIVPVKTIPAINCQPELMSEPPDFFEYRMWQSKERTEFLNNPEKKKESNGWQKFYYDIAENPTIKMKDII